MNCRVHSVTTNIFCPPQNNDGLSYRIMYLRWRINFVRNLFDSVVYLCLSRLIQTNKFSDGYWRHIFVVNRRETGRRLFFLFSYSYIICLRNLKNTGRGGEIIIDVFWLMSYFERLIRRYSYFRHLKQGERQRRKKLLSPSECIIPFEWFFTFRVNHAMEFTATILVSRYFFKFYEISDDQARVLGYEKQKPFYYVL